jgi:multiple sugar transport system permease protein
MQASIATRPSGPSVQWRKVVDRMLVYGIAAATVAITILPIFWLVVTAFRSGLEIVSPEFSLLPRQPTLDNFVQVFGSQQITSDLASSLIVSIGVVVTNLLIGPPAAYAMARYTFPGEKIILGLIVFLRMVPLVSALLPLFVIFSWFGLLNTYAALIIAQTAFKLPLTIWLLRGFFRGVPRELDDAARVDGCSTLGTLFRVVLPLIKPGLAAASVLAFLWTWNDFIVTLVLSTGPETQTLPLGLSKFVREFGVDWGPMTAAGVLMLAPVLVFVFIAERYLVRGLTAGGVKE